MRWWFSFGWLYRTLDKRRQQQPARRWVKHIYPRLEPLEVRQMLDNKVWLPQQLTAFDGTSQSNVAAQLFQPATTALLPQLGLQGTSVSASGSVSLTDSGVYSLTLTQSGAYDGNGDRYTFTESGPVTFSLVELGTLSASGFSINSVALTETATLSWSFVETNSSGQTVQNLGGANSFTVASNGAAPFDPLFPQGFNWLPLTQQISSLNTLGLFSLPADSLSVGETGGSESYLFQETNGVATVQGNVQQPLSSSLMQSGQNSYSDTAVEQFDSTQSGSDSFSLTELGSYANNSYAMSNVSYTETGGQSSSFNATVTDSQSGTGSGSGAQSFSGNNHSLGDSSGESYSFTGLSTLSYGESASSNYTLTENGSYGGDSFNLSGLGYNANGSGGYSLTQTSLQTQTGTFNDSSNASGADSYGIAGTLSGSGTSTDSGNFTSTSNGTLHDNESGNFTLSEGGGYGNGSWSLSSFNLSESLSGTFAQQQLGTTTASGNSTITDSGAVSDSFALNYGSTSTTSANGTSTSTDTSTGSFTLLTTGSSNQSGASSYTLSEVGSLLGGVPNLTSYVFTSGQSGTYSSNGNANQTEIGSGQDSIGGSGSGNDCASNGGISNNDVSSGSFTGTDSFSFTNSDSSSSSDGGSFSQSAYQAGVYNNGSYALSSVAYNSSQGDNWSSNGADTSTDSGSDTNSNNSNDQNNGTVQYENSVFTGPSSETDTQSDSGTFSNSSSDSFNNSGSSRLTITQLGVYGNYSFSFGSVLYQSSGSSTATTILGGTDTAQDSGTDCITTSDIQNSNGCLGVTSGSDLNTYTDTTLNTFSNSGNDSLNETLVQTDSYTLNDSGNFQNGLYSFSNVTYQDVQTASWSLTQVKHGSGSGTDSWSANGNDSNNAVYAFGGLYSSGLALTSSVSNSLMTPSSTSTQTLNESGQSGFTLNEYGVFANYSYSFASVVYQGSGSSNGTVVSASSTSFSLSGNDSITANGNECISQTGNVNSGSGVGSSTQQSQDTYTQSGQQSSTTTTTYSTSFTLYSAGCYSAGSYSFASVTKNNNGNDSWSMLQNSSLSESGTNSFTNLSTMTQNGTVAAAGTTLSSNGTVVTLNTGHGNFSQTNGDTLTATGHDTWSQSYQGNYNNFSYSFGTVVSQQSSTQSSTLQSSGSDSYSDSGSDSVAQTGTFNSNGVSGGLSSSGNGQLTLTTTDTYTDNGNDSFSGSDQALSTKSLYQSGSYALGSFAFASVNYSNSSSDTLTQSQYGTLTQNSTQTQISNASTSNNNATSGGASNGSGVNSLIGNSTVASVECSTSMQSQTQTGTDSSSLTEQGVYSNYSYSFASVVYQASGNSNGTVVRTSNDSFNDTGSETFSQSGGFGCLGASSQLASGGQYTFTSSANDNYNESGTNSSTRTGNPASTYNMYNAGSYANGSYGLSSVVYNQSDSDSFTLTQFGSSTESGHGSFSNGTTNSSNSTLSYGPGYVQSNSTTVSSNSGGETFLNTAQTSLTQDGISSDSMTQLGVYNNGSFSFTSVTMDTSDQSTITSQDTATQSVTKKGTDSSKQTTTLSSPPLNGGGGNGTNSGGTLGSQGTGLKSSGDSFTLNSVATFTGLDTGVQSFTLNATGCFANGSYLLSTLSFSSFARDSFTLEEDSLTTKTGTQSSTFTNNNYTNNGCLTDGGFVSNGGINSLTQGGGQSVTFTSIVKETQTRDGVTTVTQTAQGNYELQSYSFGTLVFQTQSDSTVTDDLLSTYTSSGSITANNNQTLNNNNAYNGVGASGNQGTLSNSSAQTLNLSQSDYLDRTTVSTNSYSLYQSGNASNGSNSFATIVFNDTVTNSVSSLETTVAIQTGTLSGGNSFTPSSTNNTGYGGGLNVNMNQNGSANSSASNASFSSAQTLIVQDDGDSTFTLYEAGGYSNNSLSLTSYSSSGSASDSFSLTLTQTQSSLQTASQSGNQSSSYQAGDPYIAYSSQDKATFTAVSSISSGLTLTVDADLSYSFSQQGVYNNGSFSLTSVVSDQSEGATQSSTSVAQSSISSFQ